MTGWKRMRCPTQPTQTVVKQPSSLPTAGRAKQRGRLDAQTLMNTALVWVQKSTECFPPSVLSPECLYPPNGMLELRSL